MKKQIISLSLLLLILSLTIPVFGQKKPKENLKKKRTLAFTMESGTNGAAVAYDPDHKLYYAVIAGNSSYPLEAFNKRGKPVSGSTIGIDLRGMWYNPERNRLEGNGFGAGGYVVLERDIEGVPLGSTTVFTADQNQPGNQSVGDYDPISGYLVFYDGGSLYFYDATTGDQVKSLQLKIQPDEYNYTTVACTGQEGNEYMLLNFEERKLVFANAEGKIASQRNLPEEAIVNEAFRFSFANKLVWLYDVDTRTWTGYKVF